LQDRARFGDARAWERQQFARLCELRYADVIYVRLPGASPEHEAYLHSVLGLAFDVDEMVRQGRLTLVIPEAHAAFAPGSSLSAMLAASPKALATIRERIAGANAFLVPGLLGFADLELSAVLKCPIMMSEGQQQLVLSRSAQRHFLQGMRRLGPPPGLEDVRTTDVLYAGLQRLMRAEPHIQAWLLRANDDAQGQHLAFLRRADLPAGLLQGQHTRGRSPEPRAWSTWEAAIAAHARYAPTSAHRTWPAFLAHFLQAGGVVEADATAHEPALPEGALDRCLEGVEHEADDALLAQLPRHVVVHYFVDPMGNHTVLGTGDVLYAPDRVQSGCLYPQSALAVDELEFLSLELARHCCSQGIFGYLSVHLTLRAAEVGAWLPSSCRF
jgi:hypothetical protein